MTDIDIDRLYALAKTEAQPGQRNDTCLYQNTGCTVLALIERLQKAEAQRDRLAQECIDYVRRADKGEIKKTRYYVRMVEALACLSENKTDE